MARPKTIHNKIKIKLHEMLKDGDVRARDVMEYFEDHNWRTIKGALKSLRGQSYIHDGLWWWTIDRSRGSSVRIASILNKKLSQNTMKARDIIRECKPYGTSRKVRQIAMKLGVKRKLHRGVMYWTYINAKNMVWKKVEQDKGFEKVLREEVKLKREETPFHQELKVMLKDGDLPEYYFKRVFEYRLSEMRGALIDIGGRTYIGKDKSIMWTLRGLK